MSGRCFGARRPLAAAALVIFACTACGKNPQPSPVSPGGVAVDPALALEVQRQWSPYIVVHSDGGALGAYRDAISALKNAGQLKGARVEIVPRNQNPTDPVIKAIGGLGVELLGLVSNEYLFEPDIEGEIDRIFAAYPEIRYFQIGNEVTTILPRGGPTIDIDGYMAVFRRVYDHVQAHYPGRAILVTQSTLGSGPYGPMELEAMLSRGLADMNPDRVILAINAYDPDSASQYLGLLGGPLRGFRVWVTESGVPDPDKQVAFVRDKYPRLRDYLRAERVYWYTMWGGDSGPDTGFSLIRNPASYPNEWRSPLLELLAGPR
jgi:hypothetical protein